MVIRVIKLGCMIHSKQWDQESLAVHVRAGACGHEEAQRIILALVQHGDQYVADGTDNTRASDLILHRERAERQLLAGVAVSIKRDRGTKEKSGEIT